MPTVGHGGLIPAIRCTLVNCTCECFQPGKINLRMCDQCKHGWVAHALDKLSTQHLYHPTQVEIVQSNVVFDISSLMLYGTQAVPIRLKILLDRLFSVLKQEEVLHILHGLGWTLRDYVRGYILQDAAGKVLDRWTIMSREEEIITLQQFLRFGETKSIVELMAIQEKEGQAITVPSSKTDSDIRTFIESNNRSRSPSLLTHLENSSPSTIHHFENIPNSLAFLLPFQYINPVSAPMLGLPPNGLMLEQPGHRPREPSLPNPSDPNESSESEVSLSPFRNGQSPSLGGTGVEPKPEPASVTTISPTPTSQQPQQQQASMQQQQRAGLSEQHAFVKSEQAKSIVTSSFSSKMHRMRRMGSTSRKGRVCCNACGKTFYDKGTLKIHYNAVHLKIKHRCTIEGCNMVFSSLRSRNRHSANPNPRLHMPMLRNNRDKDLIRSSVGSGTSVISSTKSGLTLTSPGRPPLGFTTPPLEPMLQSPLQSSLIFPSLKSVQPVQPVPPFYRALLSPGDLVSSPVSLPTSPILPLASNNTSLIEPQASAPGSHNPLVSEAGFVSHKLPGTGIQEHSVDPTPKKKPRKSSMPVKIEKEVISVADVFDDKEEEEEEEEGGRVLNGMTSTHGCHHPHSHLYNNSNHSGGSSQASPSRDEVSPGLALRNILQLDQDEARTTSEIRCMDSFSSEEQDHERDFENESEASESKMFCGDELIDTEDQRNLQKIQELEDSHLRKEMADHSSPSPHQPVIKIKEELSDPTYDVFCMSQYGLHNGGGGLASMAALHETFMSSMSCGASLPRLHPCSSEGNLCSSPDPKICYVCKKSFKSSYSVKLHYRNVHLKEMHMCTTAGCTATFSSRRSRDRHSANINLHRKLLTKELGELRGPVWPLLSWGLPEELLTKICGSAPLGLEATRRETSAAGTLAGTDHFRASKCFQILSGDCKALDLSSSQESIEGSDELEGASEREGGSNREDRPRGGAREGFPELPGQGVDPSAVLCMLCHKTYSCKGTHFKTVHLRQLQRCEVPGCSVAFSSARSHNQRSQNPSLHRHVAE
ncbi:zinc finger protein basonuclin-2-like isoform X3 [Brienomyrus brachyistius]|uniref:zinc finger protein basonuclin-2-like isoform X3 n=1 Tax=Brienomyrus brachyistius TaxID=42636 RepID=UPI0020B33CF1|nr:zinc finger protein basonuclin-2-like isoform X3 [Brienomyrus brachyistius]